MVYWCNKDVKKTSKLGLFFWVEMGKGKGPIKFVGHLVWIKFGHFRCGFLLHF
jgi:hypothetical protein